MINALGSYPLNLEQNIKVSTKVATKQTSSEVLGYKVDKDGYFTDEFNKQAGIPSDYKIHSSTLESLVRIETQPDYMQRAFDSIDTACCGQHAGSAFCFKIRIFCSATNSVYDADSWSRRNSNLLYSGCWTWQAYSEE